MCHEVDLPQRPARIHLLSSPRCAPAISPPAPLALLGLAPLLAVACGSDGGGGGGGKKPEACPKEGEGFTAGDPTGHADPFGAKAASQARAGRITSEAQVVQPAHGRQRVRVGDFVLANERISAYVEDKGLSDGYARFGGELLAIDRVGDDGRPVGNSYYVETLMALSTSMVDPDSVSVINDGSDGKAAIVRVAGQLKPIPFLDGSLGALFPRRYDQMAAYEYVLEPGSDKLLIRIGMKNPTEEPIATSTEKFSDEMHGFFQSNLNQFVTAERGFESGGGKVAFAGFVTDFSSFAWRVPGSTKLEIGADIKGFVYSLGPGFVAEACKSTWHDYAEVIPGGPDLDGAREAVRVADGLPSRSLTGVVKDGDGSPVEGAYVHALDDAGAYVSRTRSDASGKYTLHTDPGLAVKLVAQKTGYALTKEVSVAGDASSQDLTLAPHGTIHVTAKDKTSGKALPVRVQIIPKVAVAGAPPAFGVEGEANGRLLVERAISGEATLRVPPGEHRVVVTRGWEWELLDTTVNVAAGQTAEVVADLEHSVDSTGWMCADFHIHSWFSADSNDPVNDKVMSAVTDGLEIPVSSEHEWVIDFQPIVEKLGLKDWAFGMPSEELTTFTWGHFGVVPLFPKPDEVNNGAIEWTGKKPPEMFADVQGRPENPVLIVNHPSQGAFTSYFDQAAFDDVTAVGKQKEIWSTDFDAVEVWSGDSFEESRSSSVRDWFGLLNAGHTMWGVGSSDTHHIRTKAPGYPRTCLYFGHDDPTKLSANAVRDVLAKGVATVSGGLFMTVEGPGGVKPGSTVAGIPATADFTVTVQTASFVDATELEIFVNGVTQKTEPLAPLGAGPGKKFVNPVTVTLDPSKKRNYVVFHAKGEKDMDPLSGKMPFAASNPVFFE
ncbi:MAG: CehA/McbA family metallohydrolase [Myxococcales bacterium]|nr:CehA/McbA family metallohydrolase [Myxococcales bacterium]